MQEIIVSKQDNKKIIAIVEDTKLEEIYEEKDNVRRLEGNIYIGIIKDILPGMQAAFVDIGENKKTFLHIKDLIPKVSNITGNKNENLEKYNIKDFAKINKPILVQVKKDATKTKGAKISTDINIAGRFIALVPNDKFITVSQKIENKEERERLKKIVENEIKNKEVGCIIRTAAENKDIDTLKNDIENTLVKWKKIKLEYEDEISKKDREIKPKALYESNSILEKILLDTIDNGVKKIYVDDKKIYKKIVQILDDITESSNKEVQIVESENLLNRYDLNSQIEETKKRKIWLKCGGFITIDKTEALTAIDVNSGKFTGKENLEQTVLKVNKEASREIAKQLKLRDIGGIIVIDYIDMHDEESRKMVLETLTNELKKDRSKTQIIEFTKLDLLELTRKHMFSIE